MMNEKLQLAAKAAVTCERDTELPAELTFGQWAIESAWGAKSPGNNPFGIKELPGVDRQLLDTYEYFTPTELNYFLAGDTARTAILTGTITTNDKPNERAEYKCKDWFAKFPTLAAAFSEHARLITHGRPYRKAWYAYLNDKNVDTLIEAIAPIYATAPSYTTLLLKIVKQSNILDALHEARNN